MHILISGLATKFYQKKKDVIFLMTNSFQDADEPIFKFQEGLRF